MDEITLVEKLRNQEPDALAMLYSQYRDRVFAVTRRIVRDDWDAEEAVQDTFWTVYRKIDYFREDSALWSWMYRIAVNAAKMKVRKYKRYPVPLEDDLLKDLFSKESGDDLEVRPDHQLWCQRIINEMEDYLGGVSETNRDLFMSMEVDGEAKEEVAERLNLTVPAVKTRLHRLRVGLRDRIAELYETVPA